MGSVQQAVLEFDEEVRAPWRPRLVVVGETPAPTTARAPLAHPARRSPSRVGVCRPAVAPLPGRRPIERADQRPAPASSRGPAGRRARPRPDVARQVRLRLTRRARRLVAVLALGAAIAMGSWVGVLGDSGDLRLAGESTVVVQPGDTLWSIASSVGGDGDVRAVIDQIQQLNELADAGLVPGQTLWLP